MYNEYKLMKSHDWKNLDDYYHCKANYNATKKGPAGETTAVVAGNYKEAIDYFKNRVRGKTYLESVDDYWHDLIVNEDDCYVPVYDKMFPQKCFDYEAAYNTDDETCDFEFELEDCYQLKGNRIYPKAFEIYKRS